MKYDVSIFTPYPFKIGQKIRIVDSQRQGDWEIAAIGDNTVTLRCPISKKEFEWKKFCYLIEERSNVVWPEKN